MIAGLQPETFTTFIEQRGRWATGMMQLLRLKNPLRRKGMSLSQRLCYLNSMTFWLFPLVRMTFILAPLAYLFFELQILRRHHRRSRGLYVQLHGDQLHGAKRALRPRPLAADFRAV